MRSFEWSYWRRKTTIWKLTLTGETLHTECCQRELSQSEVCMDFLELRLEEGQTFTIQIVLVAYLDSLQAKLKMSGTGSVQPEHQPLINERSHDKAHRETLKVTGQMSWLPRTQQENICFSDKICAGVSCHTNIDGFSCSNFSVTLSYIHALVCQSHPMFPVSFLSRVAGPLFFLCPVPFDGHQSSTPNSWLLFWVGFPKLLLFTCLFLNRVTRTTPSCSWFYFWIGSPGPLLFTYLFLGTFV